MYLAFEEFSLEENVNHSNSSCHERQTSHHANRSEDIAVCVLYWQYGRLVLLLAQEMSRC